MIEIARPSLSEFPKVDQHSNYPSLAAESLERVFIEHFHRLYKAELLNSQKMPSTAKVAWARDEGLTVDGRDFDDWLPEFKESIQHWPRTKMDLIDGRLVNITLPSIFDETSVPASALIGDPA